MEAQRKSARRRQLVDKSRKAPRAIARSDARRWDFATEMELLAAVRMARMPEPHKASLKEALKAELDMALSLRPELQLVKAADGANDNWTYLHKELPKGLEVVDFFHAAEHLNRALASAYGDGTVETQRRFNDLRHVLLEEEGGVKKVIR